MPEPKRILVLTYHFSDTTRAAGLRLQRFTEALRQRGYDVTVVGEPDALPNDDKTVSAIVPDICPGPDADQNYYRRAFQAAFHAAEIKKFDVIFVSGPPFCLFTVGCVLSREKKIPLILEFRDAWITGMEWPYRNGREKQAAKKWEEQCVAIAQKIVVVTDGLKELLGTRYGEKVEGKIEVVRHGYVPVERTKEKDGVFRIVYTGQLRGIDVVAAPWWKQAAKGVGQALARWTVGAQFCEHLQLEFMSPHFLLEAVGRLAQHNPDFAQKARVIFAGQRFEEVDRWAKRFGISGVVEQQGPLPAEQAEQLAADADVLVLNLYGIKGWKHHWCVPSKLYSYLATGNAILGLLPPGEAREIIQKTGVGFPCPPDDVDSIATQLQDLYGNWNEGKLLASPDWEYIRQFQIERQTKMFVKCFSDC